jgi:hypothetical protein
MDVIASEAKQSLYSSRIRDCHGPSGLAMTTTQIICDRALAALCETLEQNTGQFAKKIVLKLNKVLDGFVKTGKIGRLG